MCIRDSHRRVYLTAFIDRKQGSVGPFRLPVLRFIFFQSKRFFCSPSGWSDQAIFLIKDYILKHLRWYLALKRFSPSYPATAFIISILLHKILNFRCSTICSYTGEHYLTISFNFSLDFSFCPQTSSESFRHLCIFFLRAIISKKCR